VVGHDKKIFSGAMHRTCAGTPTFKFVPAPLVAGNTHGCSSEDIEVCLLLNLLRVTSFLLPLLLLLTQM